MDVTFDKIKHFSVCLLLVLFVGALLFLITDSYWLSLCGGVAFAVGIAIGKEYGDKVNGGEWTWTDIVADALGVAAGFVLFTILHWFSFI